MCTVSHAPPRPSAGRRAAALALLALLAATAAGAEELRVGGAVSLREPLRELARRYGDAAEVRLAFAASNVLAAQVRAGAPLQLLVSADPQVLDRLEREGLVRERVPFAGNRLVVVVPSDARFVPGRAADLLAPGIRRIAIPEHAVPVGRYARAWLARHGLAEAVEARAVHTEHARATLAAVDRGDADAAIVYASDARLARSARVAFEVPADEQPAILYEAAVLAGAPEAAHDFAAFLAGETGSRVLRAAGFSPPPGTGAR